eukprot:6009454-Ditylum_brightwellii.AAC.1
MPTICHFEKQECTAGRTTEASDVPKVTYCKSMTDKEIEPTNIAVPQKPGTAATEETMESKSSLTLFLYAARDKKKQDKEIKTETGKL